jgi:hypothetical protein
MSNPGVIILASANKIGRNVERFDIEDNIGESIHIHINNIRLDLSVSEFLHLAEQLERCSFKLDIFKKFKLDKIDPFFLYEIRSLLRDLDSISTKRVDLNKVKCLVRKKIPKIGYLALPQKIMQTPVYKYLSGNKKEFLQYNQQNLPWMDNVKRLMKLKNSMAVDEYPSQGQYIILFNGQNYIRDGQHRAAILMHNDNGVSKIEAKVLVMKFKGTRWKASPYRDFILLGFMKTIRIIYHKLRRV